MDPSPDPTSVAGPSFLYNATATEQLFPNRATAHSEGFDIPSPSVQRTQATLTAQITAPNNPSFPFMSLPAELRLIVYRHLVTQHFPIEPHIAHPQGARIKPRHGLGASLLRTSKQIYREAYPLLIAENTFHVNQHLGAYLSEKPRRRHQRKGLLRKIVTPPDGNGLHRALLDRLDGLRQADADSEWARIKVTVLLQEDGVRVTGTTEAEWQQQAEVRALRAMNFWLRQKIQHSANIGWEYVYECRTPDGNEHLAYRWKVEHDSLLTHWGGPRLDLVRRHRYAGMQERHFSLV